MMIVPEFMDRARAWRAAREAALARFFDMDGDVSDLRNFDETVTNFSIDAAELLLELLEGR